MHKQSPRERAQEIITENRYMTIATCSLDGKPWISPVAFAYDKQYNLFWISNKNALHSNLIRNNANVAITIFDSKAEDNESDAVYVEAKAVELKNEDDLEHAIRVLGKRIKMEKFKVEHIDDVLGNKVWRIYRATPTVVHKLVEGEYVNGQYVDKHVEISLTGVKT